MRRNLGPLGATAVACAALALVVVALAAIGGHTVTGVAIAAGCLLGSVNGPLARRALASDLGFRSSSLLRLALTTAAGILVGALLGRHEIFFVLVGLGAAQLTLAAVSAVTLVRQS